MHESTSSKILTKHTLNSCKNIPLLASFKIARGQCLGSQSGSRFPRSFHLKKCSDSTRQIMAILQDLIFGVNVHLKMSNEREFPYTRVDFLGDRTQV